MVSSEIKPVIIGITGGIGTGKSTVTGYLADKGYLVLDADKISHNITEKGSPALAKLAETFGNEIMLSDGTLNRKRMAEIAFSNPEKKKKLENIITAEVIDIISKKIQTIRSEKTQRLAFVDAPLLFESGANALTDFNWTVICDRNLQIERAASRDGASKKEIEMRIDNQMPTEEKVKLSDEVIDNSKGTEELYQQVQILINKYEK